MIFTSLGILVAAGGFLIAGIVRSSIPLLVVSLIATAAAALMLLATADLARRRVWENSGLAMTPGMAGGSAPPGTQPVLMYVPVAEAVSVGAGNGSSGAAVAGNGSAHGAPFLGYDDMTAGQIGQLISSGALTHEQLDAVRSYENTNAGRKTVLDKLDRALKS
jgi:hypothetical protein